tara:strand:+ start:243 stop:1460 length:1218 start_codon:yes stop_codon:yes gene_type:complete
MINAGILTIGNEILQGYTIDSNANVISKELTKRDVKVTIHLTVPDEISKIKEKIEKFIIKDYDYIFITGGLGPTHDDVTKTALSELFSSKYKFLKQRHLEITKKLNKANIPKCQSEILDIATPLDNDVGTAMGMYFKYKNSNLIILPGVPLEMETMLELYLDSKSLLKVKKKNIATINTFGIYETKLSEKMKPFMQKHNKHIYFSFLPSYEGVKVRLTSLDSDFDLKAVKKDLLNFLEKYAYGEDDETLELKVSNLIKNKSLNLSLAESCTGGFIAKKITDIPGSSAFFLGAIVAYNDNIKHDILNIPHEDLNRFGAVSQEVSESMAINISKKFTSDISIACTGISGPDGGSKKKPVGTVYISVKFLDQLITNKFIFKVDRKSHRVMTKQAALYMLWRLFFGFKN